jgi:hypothetical protein
MDIQGNLDLLVAYANKIALGLSMKEHAINERMIEQEGRTVYCTLLLSQHSTCRTHPNRTASTPVLATSTISWRKTAPATTPLEWSKWVLIRTCSHEPQLLVRKENERTHHFSLREEPYLHQERGRRVGKSDHLPSCVF